MPVDDKPEPDKPGKKTHSLADGSGNPAVLGKKPGVALAPLIQAQIGSRLVAVYNEVLHQPVPDRFRQLLDELDAKTSGKAGEGISK